MTKRKTYVRVGIDWSKLGFGIVIETFEPYFVDGSRSYGCYIYFGPACLYIENEVSDD